MRNTYNSSTATIVTLTRLNNYVVRTVHCLSSSRMTKVVVKRQFTPWLHKEYIYKHSPLGREQARLLQILHGFSEQVSGVAMCVLIFRFIIAVVFYENEGGWVRLNTTVVGSYLMDKR